jgi:KEOPS complex subunit Cgi121
LGPRTNDFDRHGGERDVTTLVEGRATVEDVDAFVEALAGIGDAHDAIVQAFDARYVVDGVHLDRALDLAERAHARGDGIADDLAVEVLLYAAGRRQIDRALAMGVDAGEGPVVVLVDAPEGEEAGAAAAVGDRLQSAETLGDYDPALVRDFFDVSDAELAATEGGLADVVHERVAMLVVDQ